MIEYKMLTLGMFVFQVKSAAYQTLQRQSEQRWQSSDRIGLRAAQQYLGKGDDTITLSGALMPELSGGQSKLDTLQRMADSGKGHVLLSGTGEVLGAWIITNISEDHSEFFSDGKARKIEFSLSLKRIDDHRIDDFANLTGYIEQIIGVS